MFRFLDFFMTEYRDEWYSVTLPEMVTFYEQKNYIKENDFRCISFTDVYKNNSQNNVTPKTVKLNVGGKHFEITRELVMNDSKASMLSRLVSDVWLQNPKERVFIDRDGDTFGFVLNYLRHGEIMLPKTVSMNTFLKELDFYGIEVAEGSVRIDNVCSGISSEYEYHQRVVKEKRIIYEKAEKAAQSAKRDLEDAEKALNYEKRHITQATKILNDYHQNTSDGSSQYNYYASHDERKLKEALLNKYLVKLGLEITGLSGNYGGCIVKLIR